MKTIETICAHRVQFDYFSRSANAVPSESEIEHVESLIRDNVSAGELCMTWPNQRGEFRGWWKILSE